MWVGLSNPAGRMGSVWFPLQIWGYYAYDALALVRIGGQRKLYYTYLRTYNEVEKWNVFFLVYILTGVSIMFLESKIKTLNQKFSFAPFPKKKHYTSASLRVKKFFTASEIVGTSSIIAKTQFLGCICDLFLHLYKLDLQRHGTSRDEWSSRHPGGRIIGMRESMYIFQNPFGIDKNLELQKRCPSAHLVSKTHLKNRAENRHLCWIKFKNHIHNRKSFRTNADF